MTATLAPVWTDIAEASRPARIPVGDHSFYLPDPNTLADSFAMRDTFLARFAYAIPTPEVIDRIIAFADGPIVEVGAGRGLWAHLIQLHGGAIRPTDLHASGHAMLATNEYERLREGATWTTVEQGNALTVAATAEESILLFVWPSYAERWPTDALKAFRGERVIYIGESDGGCTGDDAFHETLARDWTLAEEITIPQWWGIHDALFLYSRKEA